MFSWEKGEIKLPPQDLRRVHKVVVDAWNAHENAFLELADRVRELVTTVGKGDLRTQARAILEQQNVPAGDASRVMTTLFPYDTEIPGGYPLQPQRPLKKDLDYVTNRTVTFEFGFPEAYLSFDRKHGLLLWEVAEAIGAVDLVHEDPRCQAMFGALDAVSWIRGSGGIFYGEGGRRTRAYGPLGGQSMGAINTGEPRVV